MHFYNIISLYPYKFSFGTKMIYLCECNLKKTLSIDTYLHLLIMNSTDDNMLLSLHWFFFLEKNVKLLRFLDFGMLLISSTMACNLISIRSLICSSRCRSPHNNINGASFPNTPLNFKSEVS